MAVESQNDYYPVHSLTDAELARFQSLIHELAGIYMNDTKRSLISGRLGKRLRHHGLHSYREYAERVESDTEEQRVFVDLLTTNETYFFREPAHYEFFKEAISKPAHAGGELRIWSAACSTGEEPYSLAMVLAEQREQWRILASDINFTVVETAKKARYPLAAADKIPRRYLEKFCLRGIREQAGWLLIDARLREKIDYKVINLNARLPDVGLFDFIFLRNILIYFNPEGKRNIVTRVLRHLRPGGHLIVGHSETLTGIHPQLKMVRPSVYAYVKGE